MRFAASFLAGCLLLAVTAVSQAAPTIQASPAMPMGHFPPDSRLLQASTACVGVQNTVYAGGWLADASDIRLYTSPDGGKSWDTWLTLAIGAVEQSLSIQLVYLTAAGQVGLAHVAYNTVDFHAGVYFARFQPNGTQVGNSVEVSRPSPQDNNCRNPRLYVDAGGRIHCVYSDIAKNLASYDVTIIYCYSDDGVTFSGHTVIHSFSTGEVAIGDYEFFLSKPLVDITGASQTAGGYNLAIAYATPDGSQTYNLRVEKSQDRGVNWQAEPSLANPSFNEYNPKIAMAPDFNILLTAARHNPSFDQSKVVYFLYDETAGSWNTSLELPQQGTNNTYHDVETDSTGLFHIVYENNGLLTYAQTLPASFPNIGNYFNVGRLLGPSQNLNLELDMNEAQSSDRYPVVTWLDLKPDDPVFQTHISATAASFWDTAPSLPAILEFLMD